MGMKKAGGEKSCSTSHRKGIISSGLTLQWSSIIVPILLTQRAYYQVYVVLQSCPWLDQNLEMLASEALVQTSVSQFPNVGGRGVHCIFPGLYFSLDILLAGGDTTLIVYMLPACMLPGAP